MKLQDFINSKIIESDNIDRVAFEYFKNNNINNPKFLGKGHLGSAYLKDDGNVVKFTKDPKELYASLLIQNSKHENIVSIYKTKILSENIFLIEQEYTEHTSLADDLYWKINDIVDRFGFENINELIESDYKSIVSDKTLLPVLDQFKDAMNHFKSLGLECGGLDLQSDNFSFIDGKVKFFDCSASSITKKESIEMILNHFSKKDKNKALKKII